MSALQEKDDCMLCSTNGDYATQSDLTTNIIEQRWDTVHSILCSYQFIDGILTDNTNHDPTLLHLACSQASVPYEIINSILQIYGKSCYLIEDEDGNLPIHIACSTPKIDLQILRLLLELSPDTGEQRK